MTPVSISIPAYNEEQRIGSTLTQLSTVMKQQDMDYEIMVVDDGSTDATAQIVRQQEGVRTLQQYGEGGYGATIRTGIRQADHDCIAIIDADGTSPSAPYPFC